MSWLTPIRFILMVGVTLVLASCAAKKAETHAKLRCTDPGPVIAGEQIASAGGFDISERGGQVELSACGDVREDEQQRVVRAVASPNPALPDRMTIVMDFGSSGRELRSFAITSPRVTFRPSGIDGGASMQEVSAKAASVLNGAKLRIGTEPSFTLSGLSMMIDTAAEEAESGGLSGVALLSMKRFDCSSAELKTYCAVLIDHLSRNITLDIELLSANGDVVASATLLTDGFQNALQLATK